MKLFYFIIIFIFFLGCSFDDKSGIWKNINETTNENSIFNQFETLSSSKVSFKETVNLDKSFRFVLPNIVKNDSWTDEYYKKDNNYENFNYSDLNKLILKSKKISNSNLEKRLLVEDGNVILHDQKGNIIVFSIKEKKIIRKFNFYKKRFKKINKKLNLIVEKNIIYISDNVGYLYAYNYKFDKIVWAKNYKIPFRSNLKISKNKLIAVNQNNILYFLNKSNGEMLSQIPTEETKVKNQFINNLSTNENSTFFLNTYGSLYSINNTTMKINWFLNLNQSSDLNPSNLFFSSQVVINNDKLVVATNQFTYVLNANSGKILQKRNFTSIIKPMILNNYLFLISKNNLLIAVDLNDGKIIYSYNINDQIADFLKIKKKQVEFKELMFVNNQIFIYLTNSFLLRFDINGRLSDIQKLPNKIKSYPIIVQNNLLYLSSKNKLSVLN